MMRIATLQMKVVDADPAAAFARIERAAGEAAAGRAGLLVTPELALPGYGAGDAMPGLAEPPDGGLLPRLQQLSKETGIAIVAGFAERDGDCIRNSAVFVENGKQPVIYRKSHLYGTYERDLFRPGEPEADIFECGGLKLGMLICYDVEFPENVRRLAQAGVQAVLVPTALPASPHADLIARKMIPVRAFENQIFVAYVNFCGRDSRFAYAGLSGIAAPDGTLLAQAGESGEELLIADLIPGDYVQSAAENTYLADLRV
jgi:predicted amidohydrolase